MSKGVYRFPVEEWDGISEEAKDFVRGLLQMDPRRRMTAEEALRHPWIARTDVDAPEEDPAMEEGCSVDEDSVDFPKVYKPTATKKSSRVRAARRKMRKAMFGI